MGRKIKPLWIEPAGRHNHGVYIVCTTAYQAKKLPSWVFKNFDAYMDDDAKHVRWRIDAKDELEAYQRFVKLWDALSVFHEGKDQ